MIRYVATTQTSGYLSLRYAPRHVGFVGDTNTTGESRVCTVSMIYDHYYDKWKDYPWPSSPYVPMPVPVPVSPPFVPAPAISPAEIEEFRKLLERARQYDKDHNQPDCELAEKRKKIKELADKLGVAIDFL